MSSSGVTLENRSSSIAAGFNFPRLHLQPGRGGNCNRQLIRFRDRSVYGK